MRRSNYAQQARAFRALAFASVWLAGSAVHAHPVPALSPDFGAPECITVVDKRTSPMVPLDYFVGYDDVMEEPDHIPVPDQKTHQFFAFTGQVTGQDPTYHYWPFDPAMTARVQMPVWINQEDLLACEAKNAPEIAPDFTPAKIGTDTLTERPEFTNQWLNVRQMRVPITERQALLGLPWMLADVPAGVYQAVGYVYSPPYNAWEARPGVIKVIDGTRDVPAVTVNSVDAMLFAGQGRKITGCVNAASGTELHGYYRTTESPDAPWTMFTSQPIDETGMFELCYSNPGGGFAGILEMRVVAVGPDGTQTAAYAPDQLVVVPSAAACTPSSKLCCDAAASAAAAPAAGAAAPSVNMPTAGTGTITQAAAMTTQSTPAMPPPAESSGCSVRVLAPSSADVWSALAMLLMAAGVRRRRGTSARRA